jgi:hypothetical protein
MSFAIADRVWEQASFSGSGAVTLSGTPLAGGYQSFLSGWGASGTGWYCIFGGSQWETGIGDINAGGTTLTRTTPLNGSSGPGVTVSFLAGVKNIIGDAPADVLDLLNQQEISIAAAATTDIGALRAGRIAITGAGGPITSLGTAKNKLRLVRFTGAPVLTNSGALALPGGVDLLASAGGTALLASDNSGNWRMFDYQSANGGPAALEARLQGPALGLVNGTLVESHAANAATYAIKTLAGVDPTPSDPVVVYVPTTGGSYVKRLITAAMSVVIASGALVGTASGVPFRLRFSILDNAGALQLAVRNCSDANGVYPFPSEFDSTTAISAAAASAGVTYSTSAVAGIPFAEIGCANYNSGLVTAGTWNAGPSTILLVGPHYKYAGQLVKSTTTTGAFGGSTTSSTYQNTTLTLSIALTAAMNVVRYAASTSIYSAISANSVFARMHRGATAIGCEGRGYTASGGEMIWCYSTVGLDKPGTVASTAYMVKIRNSNNTNSVSMAFGSEPSTITLEELAG